MTLEQQVAQLREELSELRTRFFDAIPHTRIRCPACIKRVVWITVAELMETPGGTVWTCAECFVPSLAVSWAASGALLELECVADER